MDPYLLHSIAATATPPDSSREPHHGDESGPVEQDDAHYRRCNEMKNSALTDCVRVQFMLDSIQKLGCKLTNPQNFITCTKLDGTKAGGFQGGSDGSSGAPDPHIYIAQDVSAPPNLA